VLTRITVEPDVKLNDTLGTWGVDVAEAIWPARRPDPDRSPAVLGATKDLLPDDEQPATATVISATVRIRRLVTTTDSCMRSRRRTTEGCHGGADLCA